MPSQILASRLVVLGGIDQPLRARPGAVELRDGHIAATHPLDAHRYEDQLRELARQNGLAVHDFGERAITPAFVNAHTHLVLGFLRAADLRSAATGNLVEELFFRVEERLDPGDVRAFARMGAYESLLSGVGLVWDHYYHAPAVAQALLDTGLAGVVAPALQDLAGPGRASWEAALEATEALAGDARLRARGVFAAVGPHATDTVSEGLWRRAAALAERLSLPLHAHAAQSIEEYERVSERYGRSPLAWLASLGVLERVPRSLLVHCLYASRLDLAQLDPARQVLAICPYAQRVFGFPADPTCWSAAGVEWVVATDTSAGNDSLNLQKELRGIAELGTAGIPHHRHYQAFLQHGGTERARALWRERRRSTELHAELCRPESLLGRVWSVPGKLHPAFSAGAIEPGALANLLVWDCDHPSLWPVPDGRALLRVLAMGDTTQAIHALYVLGRPIGAAGDFHRSLVDSPGYREALAEAQGRLARVLESS